MVKVEDGAHMADKQFRITVAPELAGKAAGFCPERHEGCAYIIVVERFEPKTPVVASRLVNKDKSVLEAPS